MRSAMTSLQNYILMLSEKYHSIR